MKKESQYQPDRSVDGLGIIVASHYYGVAAEQIFREAPPLPYDDERDSWTLQPRRPANTIVRLKKSEINMHPRRSFWGKLFGREA